MVRKHIPRAATALALGSLMMFARPAHAQLGAQNVPDLSGFADEISQSMSAPSPETKKPAANGLFETGLKVPSLKPGATAQGIGKQLRETIEQKTGPKPELAKLETEMPKALTGVETALTGLGMSKRDMGIAVAFAFITFWETANNREVPVAGTKVAGKAIAMALGKSWKPKYAKMPPATQEKIYETLLISPTLLNVFAAQFTKANKPEEAEGMRQTAGQLFEKLIGVPATQVEISDDGHISGLADDKPAETP